MAEVAQHLSCRGFDIELARGAVAPSARISFPGVGLGRGPMGESRHRVGQDALAWQSQQIECLSADQQRLGRVQSARDAEHDLTQPRRPQTLSQARHLGML